MSAVAMYGQQQSASLERRLEQIFKVVEWAIFLGLCFAAYFVMVGVWEHYMSLDANLKRLTESISDAPTMLITFHPTINNANGKEFEFRNDFNLSYSIWGGEFPIINLTSGMNYIKTDGMNFPVKYEKLRGRGHKISSDFISASSEAIISVHFDKSIMLEDLPRVEIYITSEENAYGTNIWRHILILFRQTWAISIHDGEYHARRFFQKNLK